LPSNLDGLRITFLAGTLGQGGAERQLMHMLRALQSQGAVLSVLSLTKDEFWENPILTMGIPVTWVGQSSAQPVRLQRIVAELLRDKPHVVQSCHCFTNAYVAAAARLAGVREVGAIRSATLQTISGRFSMIRRWSLHHLRSIAVNSRASIESAIDLGVRPNRLFHLPNVVDTDQFFPCGDPHFQVEKVRLLAVGRLSSEKRFDRLLRVLADLPMELRAMVSASIAGDGPLRPVLEQQARELGLDQTVRFLGAQPDMAPIYREHDLLALTSDSEGSPNVVLEAMASGLAVVGTRTGGVAELVDHGVTGLIARPSDEVALAVALQTLIRNRDLRRRMGAQARDRTLLTHSAVSLPRSLGNLYQMALT
jgi:glycosyltransferase involved in cell wall biosynthesis